MFQGGEAALYTAQPVCWQNLQERGAVSVPDRDGALLVAWPILTHLAA